MPFTFSHPAIVLPLRSLPKKWISLTGLIVGSLTPDFEYFIRMKVQSVYSHSLIGLFWFDLPLGILLAFLFHMIIRDTLFENLPMFLYARFSKYKQFHWLPYFIKKWPVVLLSILIGSSSHIFWDGFTHERGYFVNSIPFLTNAVNFWSIQMKYYKILQHVSSIIGAVVVYFSIIKISTTNMKPNKINLKYWSLIIVFTVLIIAIVTSPLLGGLDYKSYGHLIVKIISAFLLSIFLTSILVKFKIRVIDFIFFIAVIAADFFIFIFFLLSFFMSCEDKYGDALIEFTKMTSTEKLFYIGFYSWLIINVLSLLFFTRKIWRKFVQTNGS